MRLVFASAEVSPFAKTGGLGDVCGALPKALAGLGHDVVVITPCYRQVQDYFQRTGETLEHIHNTTLRWATWSVEMSLFRSTLPGSAVPVYFVAVPGIFDRPGLYDNDDLERFTIFNRAVIATCEFLGVPVGILHAHDWHTALLPVYLSSGLRSVPIWERTASIFTIHNLAYQGHYGLDKFPFLGLHDAYRSSDVLEHFGDINLMKGGIVFGDAVSTVSPTYAKEIQTPEFGSGLDGLLRAFSWKLIGILNGIDTEEWDPEHDARIPVTFSKERMDGKAECRSALETEAGWKHDAGSPIIGIISRLVSQKGFDILAPVVGEIIERGARFIVLGTGEPELEHAFRTIEAAFPGRVTVRTRFDPELAHRIIAGSDLILMPSRYEPCGLNQMYALRYGTLPLVRLTGGLADTVISFKGTNLDKANGFGFQSTQSSELLLTAWVALLQFRDRKIWRRLQLNGMWRDFSWEASAAEYVRAYEVVSGPRRGE